MSSNLLPIKKHSGAFKPFDLNQDPLKKFEGKVVIITGAGLGLGQGAAIEFAQQGACLVIHGEESLDETEGKLKGAGVPNERILKVIAKMENADTPKKIIDSAVKTFGRIDVLVNTSEHDGQQSAVGHPNSIEWLDYLYQHFLRRAIELLQLSLPHLQKTQGNVINVSGCSSVKASASFPFDATINAAMDMFTKSYADKYGYLGIRMNTVNPSYIQSEEERELANRRRSMARRCSIFSVSQLAEKYAIDNSALKRVGVVKDVTKVLVFLASEEASYVTGANWLVDGGTALYSQEFYTYRRGYRPM